MRVATRAQEVPAQDAAATPKQGAAQPAAAAATGEVKDDAPPWWSPRNLFYLGSFEMNSWRDVLQVGRWTGAIDAGVDSYQQTTRAADGTETSLKGRLLSGGITIRNEGFALVDPRLLSGNIGLRFAHQKSDQRADSTESSQTAELIGYNFDATVLGEKPYNATLFASRSRNLAARVSGGTTDATNESHGVALRWREDSFLRDKEILPYFSALLEAREDRTQEVTSVSGVSFRRDDKRRFVSLTGHNGFETADLDFRFERIDFENLAYPAGSYQSNSGTIGYSVDFGSHLNRRSDTRMSYSSRAGASSLSNVNLSQRLAVDHTQMLSSAYFYDYSQQVSQDFRTAAHSGGATLRHVLYQNLTSTVSMFGTYQSLPNGTIDTRSAQANLSYTHRIPWNGRLTLGAGGSAQITDNKLQSSLVPVIDAPFQVPPVLGAGAGFTLNDRFVVTDSIVVVVVRGGARLPTTAGVDYIVLVEGDRTRILPQPTSAVIMAGDLVEVSYNVRVDPSIKFQTISRSINAAADWGWIALSASHDDTSQKALSGDGALLQDRRRDSARIDLRGDWGRLRSRADATIARYDYTQLVYDEWRLSQHVTYAPRDDLLVSVSADQFAASYQIPVRRSEGRALRADLDWYYRGWWLNAYASRRSLFDTQVPNDVISEYAIRLKRTWAKLDLIANFGRAERKRGGVETINMHFQLSAVRRF